MKASFLIPSDSLGSPSNPVLKWSRDSRFLAAFGSTNLVCVFDKGGTQVASIEVQNPNLIDWSGDSKTLAIASKDSQTLSIYSVPSSSLTKAEVPFEPTWMEFSRKGNCIVVGGVNGAFWLFDVSSKQSSKYQGCHASSIIDGGWSAKQQICLCSTDGYISLNNFKGEIIVKYQCPEPPVHPMFFRLQGKTCLAFSSQSKPALYLWEYTDKQQPVPFEFDSSLGHIIKFLPLQSGYIFVQFSTGKFCLISPDGEMFTERQIFNTSTKLCDIYQSKAVVATSTSMKVVTLDDPSNITDEQIHFNKDAEGSAVSIKMSPDATMCAVGLSSGQTVVYLLEVPVIFASNGGVSCYCNSMSSITFYNMTKKKTQEIEVKTQPQIIGVCSTKIALSFNNNGWFYNPVDGSLIMSTSFSSTIDRIEVSDSAYAVLMGGKITLNYFDRSKPSFTFPDFDTKAKVTAFSLTEYLLLLCTDDGAIRIFNIRNQVFLDGYKHTCPIKSITPNLSETRFAFIDAQGQIFMFNPIKLIAIQAPETSEILNYILFDILDRNLFVAVGSHTASLYHFNQTEIKFLESATVPGMKAAVGVNDGSILYLDQSSSVQQFSMPLQVKADEGSIDSLIQLNRHRKALHIAKDRGDKELIHKVGESAFQAMQLEVATEAFSESGDAATVNVLSMLDGEEEIPYIKAFQFMFNKDFTQAQKCFLESSRPETALDMRSGLLQFEHALKLAETYDPDRIPQLSFDSARQNELSGSYSAAVAQYKTAMSYKPLSSQSKAGIVRSMILAGKAEQGLKLLDKIKDQKLHFQCAQILEKQCAFMQAASIYEKIKEYNLAMQCYLRASSLNDASALIPNASDSKILRALGLQLEKSGQLEQSSMAFEKANDWDSLVRVVLKIDLNRAMEIARAHSTVSVCRSVAEHCIQLSHFREAMDFLIRAGKIEDAFRVAELHNKIDEYADLIGDNGTEEQYLGIAGYFFSKKDYIRAGKFFTKAKGYMDAMSCYLQDGSPDAMEAALELAETVPDKDLRDALYNYLMNNMKDNTVGIKYLLRMYIVTKNYEEAAVTALTLADKTRDRGKPKEARDLLFDVMWQLQKHDLPIASEMRSAFIVVHSYAQIKAMKQYNKTIAALILRRLAKHASKFPANAPNLLINGVVECDRAGFKKSAFEIAKILLTPDYENRLEPDYMKRIQKTVRRRDTAEADEEKSPCPYCGFNVNISELVCGKCKSTLPMCSITCMHMTREDWCECPNCHFPASHTAMKEFKACPLCHTEIESPELIVNPDLN